MRNELCTSCFRKVLFTFLILLFGGITSEIFSLESLSNENFQQENFIIGTVNPPVKPELALLPLSETSFSINSYPLLRANPEEEEGGPLGTATPVTDNLYLIFLLVLCYGIFKRRTEKII